MRRRSFVALSGLTAVVVGTGCGAAGGTAAPAATSVAGAVGPVASATPDVTLTLYNAQHEDLVKIMVGGFTKQSGIKVEVRSGKDFELANQLVQEDAASPADAFITENSPAMQVVAAKGLFAKVEPAILAQVPSRYSPTSGDWIGVAARTTVLVYNPSLLPAGGLPRSIMDLSAPAWKDRVGIAASGADFQAVVSAVAAVNGAGPTTEWLKGLKTNARVYSGNGAILRAVNAAEIPAGVIYHY